MPKDITPNKNASGISENLSDSVDEDLKETMAKKNEQEFSALKSILENCGGLEELEQVWKAKENAKIINGLKKYRTDLYDLLIECKDAMKESFKNN
jgi:hypothetical protein